VIAYVDSSVVLRVVLGQRGRLEDWSAIDRAVASALIEVECLRTLDRFRLAHQLTEAELVRYRVATYRLIEEIDLVEITRPVLSRASQPFATSLGTLDAIHLATAILWRDQTSESLMLATHDGALALAARSHGFKVIGS
jgi:predicted nucleic acid-binding protein